MSRAPLTVTDITTVNSHPADNSPGIALDSVIWEKSGSGLRCGQLELQSVEQELD